MFSSKKPKPKFALSHSQILPFTSTRSLTSSIGSSYQNGSTRHHKQAIKIPIASGFGRGICNNTEQSFRGKLHSIRSIAIARREGNRPMDRWRPLSNGPNIRLASSFPKYCSIVAFFWEWLWWSFGGYCRRLYTLFLDEVGKRRASNYALEQLQVASLAEIKRLSDKVHELSEQIKVHERKTQDDSRSFEEVAMKFIRLQYSSRNLRRRVDHLTHLPMGYHMRQRKRKALEHLSKQSGGHRCWVQATRYTLC